MATTAIHQPCPHCRCPRDWIFFKGRQRYVVRCRTCHCRWNVMGELIKWGRRCPVYVRV